MSNFNFLGSFLGAKNNVQKDGHDLSNQECFSAPFAVNVPLKSWSFVPNEHYRFKIGGACQTSPMREDNFAQLYGNLKAVAVPISSVMRNYMQLLPDAERETRKDPLFPDPAQFLFNLKDPLALATTFYIYSKLLEGFVQSYPDYSALTLVYDHNELKFVINDGRADMQIYDEDTFISDCLASTDKAAIAFVRMLCASSFYVTNHIPFSLFLQHAAQLCSPSGCPYYMDILRILDNLGYGNYYPVVDSIYQAWISTSLGNYCSFVHYQVNEIASTSYTQITVDYEIDGNNIAQWLIYFNKFDKSLDLMPILCYQYYVYSCEKTNYRNPSTYLITADFLLSEFDHNNREITEAFRPSENRKVMNLLELTPADFTIFFGEVRLFLEEGFLDRYYLQNLYRYFFCLSNPLLSADVYTSSQLSVVQGSIPTVSTTELTQNLVKTYAETSALYSLRQSLLRGGVTRKGQMEALFGVKGAMNTFEPVQILDASRAQVDITGLMNQAETDAAPLGSRGARGDGRFGLEFTYDSQDYGYIFVVNFFTTSMFYENFMIKREYGLLHSSWWMPQFNHLGLEPIRQTQLCFMNTTTDPSLDVTGATWDKLVDFGNDTIGYSARNFELKQEVNKVHGLFTNFGFASYNGVDDISKRYLPKDFVQGNGAFGGYVPTLIDAQVHLYANEGDLYFKPDMVNNLFVNMVSGALFGDYASDHFKMAFNFSVHKVSPMPKLGLFKLDI